jgi:hypothetical protein
MPKCSYPGCQLEPTLFRESHEILTDSEGVCQDHEFYLLIDPEKWTKAGFMGKARLEMQAIEDLAFIRAIKPEV